jgi:predicted MFS family arabinose efflux permease
MLFLALLEICFLLILTVATNPLVVLITFIIHHAIGPLLLLCLNVGLEDQTQTNQIGETRGLFLSILSIAAVTAPIFSGTLFEASNGIRPVYLMSALFMVLFFLTVFTNFKNTKSGEYKKINTLGAIKELIEDRNLTLITIAGIILQFTFSWLIIYLPLYLHNEININFKDIGIIISITLLPFLFLEIPVGELADRKYGEKEFLIGGILTVALAFLLFNFVSSGSILIWGLLILLSRTGASIMETAIETYFYKKAKGKDELISIFSLGSPIAYIIGPLLGSITLLFIPFKYMFSVLSVILVLTAIIMTRLVDTR